MKPFRAFLLWAALAGAALAQPPNAVNPAMASFADIYRATVSASDPLALQDAAKEPAAEGPVRVSAAPAQAAPEIQFRVTPAREPERWLLLLAGVALAGWVAHRRLVNWF
ncbi:MAG: hypothetical protein ACT4P4_17940 [Betaproteobacteria bacterium]